MNKLIYKVKENQYKLKYQQLGAHIRIVVFTDVAFQNLSDSGSQGGQIVFLTDSYAKCNPISCP